MKQKMIFTTKDPLREVKGSRNQIFNFENMYSLWLFKNEVIFRKEITKESNLIFPDGRILSGILRIKQQRGPTFTREFLTSKYARDKKHFFMGSAILKEISNKTKIPEKNIKVYNPPYIKSLEFSKKENLKIISKLKKFKPDFIWVCIGNPKQEILANQLYEEYNARYFNVGAALDFLLGKKREAPRVISNLGLEGLYRLMTDFKYSKKKVWRSFVALFYLNLVGKE